MSKHEFIYDSFVIYSISDKIDVEKNPNIWICTVQRTHALDFGISVSIVPWNFTVYFLLTAFHLRQSCKTWFITWSDFFMFSVCARLYLLLKCEFPIFLLNPKSSQKKCVSAKAIWWQFCICIELRRRKRRRKKYKLLAMQTYLFQWHGISHERKT